MVSCSRYLGPDDAPVLRRGSVGAEKLTIPPGRFGGLAAILPRGFRVGSTLVVDGPFGGGVSRFCYEFLAWWSLSCGFCALVDLTGRISPAAIASSGADLYRLVVVRPPRGRLDRLASALGALIDGFSLTAVLSEAGRMEEWVLRKAAARASARRSVALFATVGGRAPAIPASLGITLRCRGWSTDRYGILRERHIEATIKEHGTPREVLLLEKATSPRLLVAGVEDAGSSFERPGRGERRREYEEAALGGA